MTTLLVGGYGPEMDGGARGVGRLELGDDGALEWTGLLVEAASPSWLHVGRGASGVVLSAVGEGDGTVSSWTGPDARGALRLAGRVAASGDGPCQLAAASEGLLVSCYGGGVLGAIPLRDGVPAGDAEVALRGVGSGPHAAQDAPHVHSSLALPDGRVLVADLGTDEVHVLRRDAGRPAGVGDGGSVSPADPDAVPAEAVGSWRRVGAVAFAPGSGPRDLFALDDGRVAVLTELSCEVVLLDTRPEVPTPLAAEPVPGALPGDHAAAIAALPAADGLTLHLGLRGSDRVGVLRVAGSALEAVGSVDSGVAWPRHLVAAGRFLLVAGQLSGTVAVHRLGGGLPVLLGSYEVPTPTHLVPVPSDPWGALAPVG